MSDYVHSDRRSREITGWTLESRATFAACYLLFLLRAKRPRHQQVWVHYPKSGNRYLTGIIPISPINKNHWISNCCNLPGTSLAGT